MTESQYVQDVEMIEKWEELGLKSELLRGIFAAGLDNPSLIQKVSVKPMIERKDIRAQAQSGTGKTAAFSIATLQLIEGRGACESIVLASTREIAQQNYDALKLIGRFMNTEIVLLMGGKSVALDKEKCRQGPSIIVGTPGRVHHMINEKYLNVESVRLMVIDEADEMLAKGFQDQVKAIYMAIPRAAQTAMFSATWSKEELEVSKCLLDENNCVVIDLRQEEQTLKGIEQFVVNLGKMPPNRNNADLLKVKVFADVLARNMIQQCVVFVNNIERVEFVKAECDTLGIQSIVSHAKLSQDEREEAIRKFKAGEVRVLISSNLLGRGVDIQQLSFVFNFDLPYDLENYIHRIGRAGRYGRRGTAINFVFESEMPQIVALEEHFRTKMEPLPEKLNSEI